MSNKLRTILLAIPVLAVSTAASADVFVFEAATDNVYLTLNGTTVTGNGGRITDFTVNGDLISFDLALSPGGYADVAAYTNLLDPGQTTVSDRFTFSNVGAMASIALGADPDLPAIPADASDLTTIPEQGLPANPYYANGSPQLVATIFNIDGSEDKFYIVASVSAVPEPSTWVMMLSGFAALGFVGYRQTRKTVVAA